MEIQVQKEQKSPVECELRVSVPAEVMTGRIETAIDELAGTVRLPGFRPGHVPRRVIVERFGTAVTQDAVRDILQEAYRTALAEAKVVPVSPGEMSDVQYQPGDPLTFTAKVEVAPEFELPRLSDITVELARPSVEDEDVAAALDALRESHAVLEPTDEPVTRDCVVQVDLQELDPSGLPIVGRVRKDLQVDLTRSQLGEDFAAKVIGLAVGGTAVVEFPVRSGEGEPKTARFQVTVQSVKRKELPPLDDEFARTVNPNLPRLDDLRSDVRRYLEVNSQTDARERMFRAAIEELLRRVDFPVPPRMVDDYLERMVEDAVKRQKRKPDAAELQRFKDEQRAGAVWNLRWFLIRQRLIAERTLSVTDDEVAAEIERRARLQGKSAADIENRLDEHDRDHIREDLLERKVLAVIESEVQTVPRPMSLAEFEGRTPGRVLSA